MHRTTTEIETRLTEEMVKAGFKFTVIGSTGGFLREGNTTILVGAEDEEVETLKTLIHDHCEAREQTVNVMPFEAAPPGAFIPNPVRGACRWCRCILFEC